jgi:hypothetical protein
LLITGGKKKRLNLVIPFTAGDVNLYPKYNEKIHNKFITAYIIQYQLIAALPPSSTNKPFITQKKKTKRRNKHNHLRHTRSSCVNKNEQWFVSQPIPTLK